MSWKNIVSVLVSLFLFVLIAKALNVSFPITVTQSSKATELSVTGEGTVEVVPDTAFVDVGVSVNNAETVEVAQKSINDTNKKIVDAMTKLGVRKADIKTSNYSIYPNYGNDQQISGYNGNVTASIKTKNTAIVSQVIDEATKAGANQVQGVRFTVDDPGKFREEARNKAIQDAKDQAEKLAKSLNIKLGKVVNIAEANPNQVIPLARSAEFGLGGGGPQIEPGTQTITSVVTLYFEKK